MADKNPLAAYGITDAQWNAADATQKNAWIKQYGGTDPKTGQPLTIGTWGSSSTTSGASQIGSALTNAATGGTLSAVGTWFNIAGAMILGIVLVVLGVVLVMRRQVTAVAFPEASAVTSVLGGMSRGGKG